MNKRIHRAAATIGTAAIGTILLAGPALANLPVPDGGRAAGTTTAQASRVRADLADLRDQAEAPATTPVSLPKPSPQDVPYLQIGMAGVAIAAFAAGAVGARNRRHHGAQPA